MDRPPPSCTSPVSGISGGIPADRWGHGSSLPQGQLLRPSWTPSGGLDPLSHSPPRAPSAGERAQESRAGACSSPCDPPSQALIPARSVSPLNDGDPTSRSLGCGGLNLPPCEPTALWRVKPSPHLSRAGGPKPGAPNPPSETYMARKGDGCARGCQLPLLIANANPTVRNASHPPDWGKI